MVANLAHVGEKPPTIGKLSKGALISE